MQKKLLSLLVIFLLLFTSVSCTAPERVDFSELLKRTADLLPEYSFDIEEAFFSDGQWFLFIKTGMEAEILLTVKEDEYKYADEVGVSILNTKEEGIIPVAVSFCEAVYKAFVFGNDTENLLTELGIYDENKFFSENTYFAEAGRFKLSFFNAEAGCTVVFDII